MAKQSGLHQIRGKVGEHSYYKQTGIESGLIRSINQGMSDRVKTGAEYANTRLNNAEFGQACRIAAVLGRMVVPKYRPMILPFSQSKIAKHLFDALRLQSGAWGQRNFTATDEAIAVEVLNSVSKGDFDEFGIYFDVDSDDYIHLHTDTVMFPAKLQAIGADGLDVELISARPWIGTFNVADNKYASSYPRINVRTEQVTEPGYDLDFEMNYRPAPPAGWPAFPWDILIVVVLPYRTVNNVKHVLQEACTFVAMEQPQVE